MKERISELILIFVILVFIIVLPQLFSSCAQDKTDDETLFLYAKAAGVYAEGRFAESAGLLSEIRNFPPALTLKGKAEFFSNKEDAAEKTLKQALKKKPADAEASIFLSRLLREKGEYKEAEKINDALLSNNPHDLRALRLAAGLALEKGPAGEAAAFSFLDRAAEASGEAALIFLERARLRWIGGNSAGALDDLSRAKAVLPENSPLRRSISSFEATILTVIMKDKGDLP